VGYDDEEDDLQASPDETVLLRPRIRWLPVDNAAEYEVRFVSSDGDEYVIHKESYVSGTEIYSWDYPIQTGIRGMDLFQFRVYAHGSWGYSEVPNVVVGFIAGHPLFVSSIDVSGTSGDDLEVVLNASS
jgi:hypothetical protein